MDTSLKLNKIINLFGLNVDKAEALFPSFKLIKVEELGTFYNHCLENKREFESMEVCLKRCLTAYECKVILKKIKQNKFKFPNQEAMVRFIKKSFKNKDLANNLPGFLKNTVIALDETGALRNTACLLQYSNQYQLLTANEEKVIYDYLFTNQHRIGDIQAFSQATLNAKRKSEQLKISHIGTEETQKQMLNGHQLLGLDNKQIANKPICKDVLALIPNKRV